MAIAVGNILAFKIYCLYNGQVSVNTLHYRVKTLTVVPTIQDVTEAFDNVQVTEFKALLHSFATYRGVAGQKIRPGVENLAVSIVNSGAGTGPANAAPTQDCGIVTKRSEISGQKGRGRVYLPFPSQDAINAVTSAPSAAYITAMTAWATVVFANPLTTFGVAGMEMTPIIGQLANGEIDDWPTIVQFTIPTKFATQRRRGPYGRLNSLPF